MDGYGPVLSVVGEFDLVGEQAFHEALRAFPPGVETVVIDLSRTEFIDSTGIRALLAAQKGFTREGVRLRLIAGPAAQRVLDLAGITHTFDYVEV
jgi:anti-anti-sigma factor